jgi:hypothetical protein
MHMKLLLPTLLALAFPLSAQGLPDHYRENRIFWEESLNKGLGTPVREAAETLLRQEGVAVNPSDYNAMHSLVAVMNLAARACVVEGAWEDALKHLDKAGQVAADNLATAEGTFAKLVSQHQEKLAVWREETAQQEKRLQALKSLGIRTPSPEQVKLRSELQDFLDERHLAIARSEDSLKKIDSLLTLLRQEKAGYAASAGEWRDFLAKERAEIQRIGSIPAYVAEKLEQVKADDARPRTERLAYGRRLLRLDPGNEDCQRFVDGLMGKDEAPAPEPSRPRKPRRPAKSAG